MENEIMNGMDEVMENTEVFGNTSGNDGINVLATIIIAGVTYVGMRLGEKGLKAGRKYLKARKAAKEIVIDNTSYESDDVEG